jgi:SAM-dependent methyltransferase
MNPAFNRLRKYQLFLERMKPLAEASILDIGFTDEEYRDSDNLLEKKYPNPDKITALGIETPKKFAARYPQVKVVVYDGHKFPFSDGQFDLGWSNAVLEHVGNSNSQILFLREIKRTCKRAFVSTPNKYFPLELHTKIPLLHWLPKPVFNKILLFLNKSWAAGDYMNLLSLKQLKVLLKAAHITNYQIVKNKIFFFTIDFVVIF